MMFLLRMLMRRGRGAAMDPLQVSMTGVRMGERFLQIGCNDKSLLAGLAAKVGLSGTAAVAAFNANEARLAASIARKVGALIDVKDGTYGGTPLDWCEHGSRNSGRPRAGYPEVERLLREAAVR